MILLLCMTVGMFGVSCTGDDGAQGPPGPKGDTGEPGEVTEADIPEDTDFYSFIKSWGSETGEIACSDPLLGEEMGPLPGGPDVLVKLSATSPMVDETTITSACGNGSIFGNVDDEFVESLDDSLGNVDDNLSVTNGFALIKTGKGAATPEVVQMPATEFNPATQVTTTKIFVGGKIFANLNLGAESTQPLQRLDLYSQCGVGTSPAPVVGHWRAVKITSTPQVFDNGEPRTNDGGDITPGMPVVTTKVCVVLDAHPGATKCFVDVSGDPVPTNNGSRIALYDGTKLTTVVSTPAGDNATGALFAANDIGDTDPAVPVRLCSLFDPADQ